MKDIFRVFWQALKDLWDEFFLLLLMNILTALLLFPIITFPPALAGLWNAGNLTAKGMSISWRDYFEGFRRYFFKAWGLALLNILVIATAITNIRFYTTDIAPFEISETASMWIGGGFTAVIFLWTILQMYPMAALLEQEDQRLRVTLRNSVVLFVGNLGFSIVLFILLLLIAVISTFFAAPWALITLAIFSVVCNKAVLHLLEPHRERMRAEEEEEEEEEEKEEDQSSEDES